MSMGFGPREGSHLMFGFLIYHLQKKAGSMEILSKPINSCPKLCGNILRENGPFQYISLVMNCFMLEYLEGIKAHIEYGILKFGPIFFPKQP